ncbi:MAG: 50S ribosomal protein L18 [Ignavibacteria bacterium]|nr:50S ribosomal protein L18 [Ignavibacteria bacterium]MBT8383848.1 50S ribosomal protein L18 [Ignavibacteria bacterium]MBT8392070.1 50S ribosomal protein L18 [Ignavibacteria bacterium]NNJ54043.1 50S ribosomal protein L18 [Ignavibacteriaceae bacterium]NNL20997.1 50S ribosomal protein L18 [Ignavibacteriaceae bacterium]
MKRIKTRERAKIKIRKKIVGSEQIPRLAIFRSLNNIYAQLIDDSTSKTIIAVSSLSKELQAELNSAKGKTDKSKLVGSLLAKKALEKNLKNVVFDRSGYKYHGRVKAVADGAREGGLVF